MKAKIIDHEGFKPFDIVLTVEDNIDAIKMFHLLQKDQSLPPNIFVEFYKKILNMGIEI